MEPHRHFQSELLPLIYGRVVLWIPIGYIKLPYNRFEDSGVKGTYMADIITTHSHIGKHNFVLFFLQSYHKHLQTIISSNCHHNMGNSGCLSKGNIL